MEKPYGHTREFVFANDSSRSPIKVVDSNGKYLRLTMQGKSRAGFLKEAVLPLYRARHEGCVVCFTRKAGILECIGGEGKMECYLSDLWEVHSCNVVGLRKEKEKKKEEKMVERTKWFWKCVGEDLCHLFLL